jgi:hypothetical protein
VRRSWAILSLLFQIERPRRNQNLLVKAVSEQARVRARSTALY